MWCCDGAVSVELWWCCVCGAMMVLCLWVSSSRRFESSQFVRVRKQNVGICTPTTRKERRCDSPQASHLCFGKEHKLVFFFDVLLTVLHLSIFISVFNQLDAQNLFHNKFYFMPLHVSSTCAHHQEVKIALHSLWYHHTFRWLYNAILTSWWWAHVLETCSGMK